MLHLSDLLVELDEARGDMFLGQGGEVVFNGGAGVGLFAEVSICIGSVTAGVGEKGS